MSKKLNPVLSDGDSLSLQFVGDTTHINNEVFWTIYQFRFKGWKVAVVNL